MNGVVIEGGGIAGQVLKKELTLRGIPARLVERVPFPREKVCGGVLQADTWAYLQEQFGLETPARIFDRIAHVWRSKRLACHRLPRPMVYVPRLELDEALRLHQSPIGDTHLHVPKLGTRMCVSPEELCVNARGVEKKGDWLGFQGQCAPVDELEMHYGRGICAGVAPTLEGNAHLAFIVHRRHFSGIEPLRAYVRSELGIQALNGLRGTGGLDYGYRRGLAVGDAKMMTFPFLGLGMKHAVLSSRLMAASIASGKPRGYERSHRRTFRRQRSVNALLGRLYDSPWQGLLIPVLRSERVFLALYRWLHSTSPEGAH